jgi:uncharacterized protein YecT (DUF1311 family)
MNRKSLYVVGILLSMWGLGCSSTVFIPYGSTYSSPNKDPKSNGSCIDSIAEIAHRYYTLPHSQGGGDGSYEGFVLSPYFESKHYSFYDRNPKELFIVEKTEKGTPNTLFQIDKDGRHQMFLKTTVYDARRIGALAYQYRSTPVPQGGGGGSYLGFIIPQKYQKTEIGEYTVYDLQPHQIAILGKRSALESSVYMFDSAGHRFNNIIKFDTLRKNYRNDLLRDSLQAFMDIPGWLYDVHMIAASAVRYRSRLFSEHGGNGSFIGFRIPEKYQKTINENYILEDVRSSEIVLHAAGHCAYLPLDTNGVSGYAASQRYKKKEEAVRKNINILATTAMMYWNQSISKSGELGSFEGFCIPDSLALVPCGTFSLTEVLKDTLYVAYSSSADAEAWYYKITNDALPYRFMIGEYTAPKKNEQEYPLETYRLADRKLNAVYKELLTIKKSDSVFVQNLRKAERLWMQYRDAQLASRFLEHPSITAETASTKEELLFLVTLTQKRTQELQDLLRQK